MSQKLEKVNPGDLITADFMNGLLERFLSLEKRVEQLEETGTAVIKISALLPAGNKRIGDPLHIIGQGFDVPSGTNVIVDSIPVSSTPGSEKDRELIVTIPNIQGVSDTGKRVAVLVTNINGSDSMDFTVYPAIPSLPEGTLFINLSKAPGAVIQANQSYVFEYKVKAIVNLDEFYSLTASVDAGWPVTIVDSTDTPLVPAEIFIPEASPPSGTSVQVFVRVSVPSGTPTGTTTPLRLTVTSKQNPTRLTRQSGGDAITVGSTTPTPGDDVVIAYVLGSVIAASSSGLDPSDAGGVVRIHPNQGYYRLTFSADIKTAGEYKAEILPISDTNWTPSFSRTTSLLQRLIDIPADNVTQTVFVFLAAVPGASATEVTLRITSTTDSSKTGQFGQPIDLI